MRLTDVGSGHLIVGVDIGSAKVDGALVDAQGRIMASPRDSVEIVKARLGHHAGVVGAALWARQRLKEERR